MRELAIFLTSKFGHGFSLSTLKNARKFYQIYAPTMRQIPSEESGTEKSQTMFAKSYPFTLGWSHYLILMRIENPDERRFYEIEAMNQRWTFRQLQRQYGSTLPEGSNIYASEYSLPLPDKGLLQQKLTELVEEFEEVRDALEAAHGKKRHGA